MRACLLGALGLKVPAQRRLALHIGALVGQVLEHFEVGRDALVWIDRPDGVK
jgi:hypothetical protein